MPHDEPPLTRPAASGRRAALGGLAALGLAALGLSCGRASAPAAELVVLAAASLRDVLTGLGRVLEGEHAGLRVVFGFAGTQELRTQLEHGARADVFASADRAHMDALARAGRVERPELFAENELVLVVSSERAATVRSLGELPSAERVVLGVPEVPVGRYALELLERADSRFGAGFRERVLAKVVSRELNVRQVLTKVRLGEADAGIVYRTDARAAEGGLAVVSLPPELAAPIEYPIAVVAGTKQPALAQAFVDLVRSPRGRDALVAAGFVVRAAGTGQPR